VAVATGVTDIRLQLTFLANRKVKRLRKALGAEGVLALIELWCYIASNEPDGFMLGWAPEEVEAAASWDGNGGEFFQQCRACGLIDEVEGGGFCVHDWAENQPFAVDAPARSERGKKAAQERWDRHRKAIAMRDACGSHTGGMQDACDSHAGGNAESENGNAPPSHPPILPPVHPTKPAKTRAQAPAADSLFRFAELLAIYPPDKSKPDAEARRWWGNNAKTDEQVDLILANTRIWLAGNQYQSGKGWNIGRYLSEGMVFTPPGTPVRTKPTETLQDREEREWKEALLRTVGGAR